MLGLEDTTGSDDGFNKSEQYAQLHQPQSQPARMFTILLLAGAGRAIWYGMTKSTPPCKNLIPVHPQIGSTSD